MVFTSPGFPRTPEDIDRPASESEIDRIRDRVSTKLPDLPEHFLHASTCLHTKTPDDRFVVAHHPEYSQVTVACGFSGHDFTFLPVIGEIVADLATDGATQYPVDPFDPRRLIPQAV